ncbi:hypothetical protein HNY73_019461 [Argiope bruennichi]|uniref:DUF5641 domain-containing protein n=1 Tax=Argiope bruennichi TaxID=94029 RepID=A0A8T0E568_ARGBR|nr:hypothetical protein HNY73_019461 [Argiope bruennichi]
MFHLTSPVDRQKVAALAKEQTGERKTNANCGFSSSRHPERRRKPFRASLREYVMEIKLEIDKENPDKEFVRSKLTILERVSDELRSYDIQILDSEYSSEDSEWESVEKCKEKLDLIKVKVEMFFSRQTASVSVASEISEFDAPDLDPLDRININKRLRHLQDVRELLRRRFRLEYVSLLVQRPSTMLISRQIKIGNIVLVECDNKRKVLCPLAKVTEIYPGKDGNIRVVRVKTASAELVRPRNTFICGIR